MKRSMIFLFASGWVATSAGAFFLGKTLVRPSVVTSVSAGTIAVADQGTASSGNPTGGSLEKSSSSVELKGRKEFLTLSGGLSQLTSLAPAQTRALIDQALGLPSSDPTRNRSLNSLLAKLAETDPLDALKLADGIGSLRDTESARRAILEVWASNDPVATLKWAETALAGATVSSRDAQMQSILRGYASHDATAAFDYVNSLATKTRAEQRMRSSLMRGVIETQIRSGGLEKAKVTIEQMPASPLQEEMMREMVDEWASFDPASAAGYVSALGDGASTRLKTSLISEWAETDPAAAAAFMTSLPPDDPAIGRSTSEIIQEWTRYDLDAPAEWLNSLPATPELDRAVATYTFRAAQEDPAGAMSWAESIVSEQLRDRTMNQVAATWKEADPASFQSYLDSAAITPEQKANLQKAQPWGGRGGFGRR